MKQLIHKTRHSGLCNRWLVMRSAVAPASTMPRMPAEINPDLELEVPNEPRPELWQRV